jgi:polyvinyl alcohol dehydrogenase (cytochrome)
MSLRRLQLGLVCLSTAFAASPDGAAIYKEQCAKCHERATGRIPGRDALARRTPEDVIRALTTGAMKEQGSSLSAEQKRLVAEFVTGKASVAAGTGAVASDANHCAAPPAPIHFTGREWNGWGRDLDNSRFQPDPGFAASDVPKLKVKWAFGYPGATFTYGQPTIIGDRLYVTSGKGTVFALNSQTGCLYWTYDAGTSARTAISVGPAPSASGARYALYFGDDKAVVHALDADTGRLLWETQVEDHPVARVTGAPILHKDALYVPISSVEEVAGQNVKYECCKFRGSVVALDARTGKQIWKTHTIPDPPSPFKKNSAGTQMYGPAGAAVWSAPTVDVTRGLIYAGTGNSYTDVETRTANAIVAIDLKTGSLKWSNQATPRDNFLVGCFGPGMGNCPQTMGPDVDFGSSPILRQLAGGKAVVLAGQKSGAVYALDPDQRGKVLWQEKIGEGSALGGVEWGFAADAENVYVGIADAVTKPDQAKPGITALKIATGERLWHVPAAKAVCSWGEKRCLPAQSQAVTVMPGAVFSGSMDGHLRAYSTKDGTVLWDFDTGKAFETVNGVTAKGGSLDAAGPTISNGVLYVNSGYGRIVGQGGNVLLAFSVDGK